MACGEELKPCPFCGGEAEWFINKHAYMVECQNCYARGSLELTKQDAIEAWNTRET